MTPRPWYRLHTATWAVGAVADLHHDAPIDVVMPAPACSTDGACLLGSKSQAVQRCEDAPVTMARRPCQDERRCFSRIT